MTIPNNQLAPRQGQAPATFSNFITGEGVRRKINEMVGGKDGQRFITSIISAVSNNPELAKCDHGTILSAAMLGESLKLSPSVQLGQFYLVPFNDRKNGRVVATFQIGYKGYIQLAIRSGQYKKLNVLAIKEGELISYDPLNEEIEVNLIQDDAAREEASTIGYYAMFEYVNGFRKTMYWSRERMEAHALRYSQGYAADKRKGNAYTFWSKDFDAMAYKTMLRQIISKWGIMSVDMQQAFAGDNAMIVDGEPQYIDAEPVEPNRAQPQHAPSVGQPAGAEQEDPESAFFGDDPGPGETDQPQDDNTQDQPAPADEVAVSESVLSGDDLAAYKAASPAEKKKKCLSYLQSFGAQQADAERLVGKGYGQWTTRDRAALLTAYSLLATGSDPAEVFPTA